MADNKSRFGCVTVILLILGAFACCCVVLPPIGIYLNSQRVEEIAEADKQFDAGRKKQAIAVYKKHFEHVSDKPKYLKRIVETELELGSKTEAKQWIMKGIESNVPVEYDSAAAKEMLALARVEADDARKKKAGGTIPYESLKSAKRKSDGKLILEVLVSESDSKEEVMKLADRLRREHAGNYVTISIFDSREAWRRRMDESYPETKLSRHWLVVIDDTLGKDEIRWVAKGRDR